SKERGFRYGGPDGKAVRDKATLERIDLLRIPPAWCDVHIAASARAAIQVWGLDARGRKQYRYHGRAVEKGQLRKYYRVRQMATDLPKLRKRFLNDLQQGGYSKDRVCAGIVLLISHAWFRVGSDRYEKENNSFGITTLRKSHVELKKEIIRFQYRGKRGIENSQKVTDPRLIAFVLEMMSTPGLRLFRYREGRKWVDANARDVNDYIENVAGIPYTAKDFRTWGGSLRAATVLSDLGPVRTKSARNKNILWTVRVVSAELGNTPAICRKSYVHPMILTRYLRSGATIAVPRRKGKNVSESKHTPEETALIEFLDEHFPDRRSERRMGRT
ncbi:MAG: DNA topoisomerase IB, partial [Gemmatimonadota bacterium]|nr:DNA topoisomerase IB [Gemmatimonadota bacterium]